MLIWLDERDLLTFAMALVVVGALSLVLAFSLIRRGLQTVGG